MELDPLCSVVDNGLDPLCSVVDNGLDPMCSVVDNGLDPLCSVVDNGLDHLCSVVDNGLDHRVKSEIIQLVCVVLCLDTALGNMNKDYIRILCPSGLLFQ